jgi:hypothetical protein
LKQQRDYEQSIRTALHEAETGLTAALESAKAWTAHRDALQRLVDKLDGTPVLRLKQAYDAGYKAGKNHEAKVYNFKEQA